MEIGPKTNGGPSERPQPPAESSSSSIPSSITKTRSAARRALERSGYHIQVKEGQDKKTALREQLGARLRRLGPDEALKVHLTGHKYLMMFSDGKLSYFNYGGKSRKMRKGGYGHVRKAEKASGESLAIKTPRKKGLSRETQIYAKMDTENEAALLQKIHQDGPIRGIQKAPKKITIHHGQKKKKIGLLGPLYAGNGKDLRSDSSFSTQPLKEKLRYLEPLFFGLNDIHGKNIHHGDIRPSNTLYDEQGPVIGDFGGAREGRTAFSYTQGYRHPERLLSTSGQNALIEGQKNDVYALAATIVDLLDGESSEVHIETTQPNEIRDQLTAAHEKLQERIEQLSSNPEAPGLKQLLLDMTSLKGMTAAEAHERLTKILDG